MDDRIAGLASLGASLLLFGGGAAIRTDFLRVTSRNAAMTASFFRRFQDPEVVAARVRRQSRFQGATFMVIGAASAVIDITWILVAILVPR